MEKEQLKEEYGEAISADIDEVTVIKDAAYFATHHPMTIAEGDEYLKVMGHYFSPSGL